MSLDESTADAGADIAVVGMAGRFPGARNLHEYWQNLVNGRESVTVATDDELLAAGVSPELLANPDYVKACAPLPDMEMFDGTFFGFSPKESAIMDPQHRHFLECAWLALEHAGHVPERFGGSIGVFGGSGHNAYMPYNLLTNPDVMKSVGLFLVRHTGNDKDFLTTRVSYLLNLRGPSINVQTACSTSLVAIHVACQSLLTGECDMALAGGVTIELPHRQGYLYEAGEILSPDGHCRSFDASSQGTVFGSGVGVVVLRRLADALADGDHIHAVIKGSAVNNDGSLKVGYLAPSVDGQARAIAEALAIANVDADTISYVEAHGTGTPVGDPIEVAALTQVFRKTATGLGYCGIGSVKSNIGHLDTAAGVAAFIKVALALEHEQLPPTLHFTEPNPACDFPNSPFHVQAQLADWKRVAQPRRAGVSSLGVGGTNAHVIVEEAPHREPSSPGRTSQLLVLSARSASALTAGASQLADHLRLHPEASLADVSYTLRVGRQSMKHRRVLVSSSVEEAVALLDGAEPARVISQATTETNRPVAFMFAGGGAQYPHMGADLYRLEPVFRGAVDECLALLRQRGGVDVTRALYPAAGDVAWAATELQRPSVALPALFITQYAQARLWMSWGILPTAMIGHSMGEYTAACLAGVFSLGDALALVALRGRLFERVPEGAMLSVSLAPDDLRPYLADGVSIAAINSPSNCVASGPAAAIEALERRLVDRDVDCVRVRISVAAHSAMLDPILQEFGQFCASVALQPPTLPIISNLSGTWLTDDEATDANYWVRHLRHTVRFADGMAELLKDSSRVLLEVGPGRTLTSLARQQPSREGGMVALSSLRHPDETGSDLAFVLTVLGKLWLAGVTIDWTRLDGSQRRYRLPLPGYAFDRQRHWIEPGKAVAAMVDAGDAGDPLVKRADVGSWTYQPVWKRSLPIAAAAAAPTGVLVFSDACGLGDALAAQWRAEGTTVTTVTAAGVFARRSANEFTVNPRSAGDFDSLVAALALSGPMPEAIVHLWTVAAPEPRPLDAAASMRMQDLSFYSLLHLAQALGKADVATPVRLMVVSNDMQRVGAEPSVIAAKATLLGPVRVIPREYANILCQSVDVTLPALGTPPRAALVRGLRNELAATGSDTVLALRGAERWVQAYEPISLAADAASPVRAGGVYLVTGGYGGIGLELAAHLASIAPVKLVLLGRSGLPPRDRWADLLAGPAAGDTTATRIRRIQSIEALGSTVLPLVADLAHVDDVRRAVAEAVRTFGTIHGVIHAAGVLDDGLIEMKDAGSTAAVMAPKVAGTLALEDALAGVAIEFLVLFSSVSAIAGLPGQIDYAAANAFLDAYAQERVARDGIRALSINWSAWQEVGMAAALASGATAFAANVPMGHPLVERRLSRTATESVYETDFSVATHWLLDEHRLKGGQALIPGAGYLEIIRAAIDVEDAAPTIELREVAFVSPFVVLDDEVRTLRVRFERGRDGSRDFAITSVVGEAWHEHVRGTVTTSGQRATTPLDLAGLQRRHAVRERVLHGPEAREHLVFGPRWNNVSRIQFGQAEALITLVLPDAFAADLDTFRLHPAVLDMATAGAQELIPGFDERDDFFVPMSYGAVTILAPFAARMFSHVVYRERESSGKQFAVFDVTIVNEQGTPLVEISEFTMARVRDEASLSGTASVPGSLARGAATTPVSSRPTIDLSAAIGTAEGLCVFDRVLASGMAPQVVVSPQVWSAVMAQTHAVSRAATGRAAPAESRLDLAPLVEALTGHPAVSNAAALELRDTTGDPRVVAYLVYDPDQRVTVSELRKYVRGSVAEALVPHTFVDLDALPLTAAGTLDRAGLPNPFGVADEVAPPETAMQKLIAEVWRDLLGVTIISVHDNFFDVGGHSLLSMRLIARIDKKTGIRLQHEHIVVNTLGQLATKCEQMAAAATSAAVVAAVEPKRGLFSAVRQSVFGSGR